MPAGGRQASSGLLLDGVMGQWAQGASACPCAEVSAGFWGVGGNEVRLAIPLLIKP